MITKKVRILINRINCDLNDFLAYVYQYSTKRGVMFHFDMVSVDVKGYTSVLRPIAAGGSGYVLQGAESLVPNGDAWDITIFMFDLNEWKAPWYWPWPLWNNGSMGSLPRSDTVLYNGKPFINLGFYANDLQNTKVTMLHELYGHGLAKIFNCQDVMDTYRENANPESLTGNFAEQTAIFQPYLNQKTMQKTVTLTRNSDNGVETLGTLVAQNNGAIFSCSTLELPWKDNQHDISCVPKGAYQCSVQPFHATRMYELDGTSPRTGVFIHPGNYFTDILGCILLGIKPSDINHDGQIDVTSSVSTVASFMQFMGNSPFTLTIR